MIMRKLLVIAVLAACGPQPAPAPIPMLPGDGDSHVVKPPPEKPAQAADPWANRNDLIAPPSALAPAPVDLPKITELKLANGLAVRVVQSPRLPIISVQLAVRAGRMHEPRARLGVAELTADLLVKGTQKRDAAQLAKTIDFVGGTIAADATFEATMLSCSVLVRNAGTCFELLPEMITQPAFPDPEVARMRDSLIAAVRQRLDDAATLASSHAQNLLWGPEHVRGWINSEQSLGQLRRDDVVAWHKAWFVPGNAILVVTGDVDPRQLKADLERTFGTWKKGPIPPTPSYSEQGLSGSRIRLVDKPGQTQTHIRIAQFGIKHDDPRFFDALVWNYALGGGGPMSRLARALRTDNKALGAATSFDRNIDRGSFVASTYSRNADAVAVTKQVLVEIARMAKDGPNKDEVETAVAGLAGNYGLRFQSAADFGAALLGAELHGFGQQYVANYPIAVGSVTVEDAKRAAGEILDPKAYVIVLVGDAKDLEPQLKNEGWRYEKVVFNDPVTAPVAQPEQPIDPRTAAAARKLIDEAIAAKGGKDRLTQLKAFKLVATGSTTVGTQSMPVEISRVFVVPDKMRIDASFKPPGAPQPRVVSVGLSGASGWQRGPDPKTGKDTVAEIAGIGLATADFERWREPELILLKASDKGAKLTTAPDENLDGKPCSVVVLRAPFGDVSVSLFIDKKTKLIGRMSYSDGGSAESDSFADYRDVAGIKLAFKRVSSGGGRSTQLEVKTFEVDPKLDATVFDKPSVN
jgi:zinc protease